MYQTGYYATGYYQTGYYSRTGFLDSLLSRTWYSLIWEARDMLKDNVEDCYRYPDSMLLNILNRGLYDLQRIRPDAYYHLFGNNEFLVPEIDVTNWTDRFILDLRFYDPLLYYVVGFAELSEDEYVQTGRAAASLEKFKNQALRV